MEYKRIYHIAAAALSSLCNKQLGHETTADADLGFKMWGGKDSDGTLTKWLAKDKLAQVTGLKSPILYSTLTNQADAIKICQADGATPVLNIDTLNKRLGVGITPVGVLHLLKSTAGTVQGGVNLNVGEATASTGTFTRDSATGPFLIADGGSLTDEGVLDILPDTAADDIYWIGLLFYNMNLQAGAGGGGGLYALKWYSCGYALDEIDSWGEVSTDKTDGTASVYLKSSSGITIQLVNNLGATASIEYFFFGIKQHIHIPV